MNEIQDALCVRCQTYSTIWFYIRSLGTVCFRCFEQNTGTEQK